jgi:hypothetical protein
MKNIPIYAALAQAFAAEGGDTHFTLMGDGNMHWAAAMKGLDCAGPTIIQRVPSHATASISTTQSVRIASSSMVKPAGSHALLSRRRNCSV